MLHTKFKGNLSSGSEEKDFLSFFYHICATGHFCHENWTKCVNFLFLFA